ncbi:protein ENL [Diachasmimorpha longicaudata]|uniref:protein ENL n=1 Tax=Diachasmimorpha longicaudata TaxID=58733 RepID=UPI0030B8F223
MAIRITLECGHVSMLRPRTTLEGYTHDWEVFIRGVDNADISQYVEKVVFQLHETFPKPKRTLKDAPYVLKESGYAGFVLPIYIYLKNKDEPKKIEISYDLTLAPSGPAITNVMRHSEIITNPPDEFRRKLLKGGGVLVSTSNEPHDKSESKVSPQMSGKPKLSGAEARRHRPMEPRSTNQFADLFGVPIKTGNKVSPETKKIQDKSNHHKLPPEKLEKIEKSSKSKSSPHKDLKKDKPEDIKKDKKDKELSKDKDRSKDKVKRPQSPPKSDYQSPAPKRPQSPVSKKQLSPHDSNIQKSLSPKIREKDHKKLVLDREKHTEKPKEPMKPTEDVKVDKKKKKHKDDKESDRKEKNREKNKEKSKDAKPLEKKSEKHEKPEKQEKEKIQENRTQKDIKKSPKPLKEGERSSSKSRPEVDKTKDQKVDKERQKHKHRKKDKKERSDDSREREKREKKDKQKSYDKDGIPTAPTTNPLSALLAEVQDRDSSDSNSGDEDEDKQVISIKNDPESSRLVSEVRLTRPVSPSASSGKVKTEKVKKEKSKPRSDDKDNRKRKRRSDSKGDDDVPTKREKDPAFSPPLEPVSSSQSPVAAEMATNYTTNVKEQENLHKEAFETEQIAPDSTNNMLVESEGDEPLVFSEDYVSQLKDLQQKIMTLQDNQELQRVVQVIAATGQYEITRKTFDFDLCALDRRTVQRLQEFFSAS